MLCQSPKLMEELLVLALEDLTANLTRRFLPQNNNLFESLSEANERRLLIFQRQLARRIRINAKRRYTTLELQGSMMKTGIARGIPAEVMQIVDELNKKSASDTGSVKRPSENGVDEANLHSFLIGSSAFGLFCTQVRYLTSDKALSATSHNYKATVAELMAIVHRGTSAKPSHPVIIKTDWRLIDFLTSQFEDGKKVYAGNIIAYTGTATCAFASTCADYLLSLWPRTGWLFLSTLQALIDYKGPEGVWVSPGEKCNPSGGTFGPSPEQEHSGCFFKG